MRQVTFELQLTEADQGTLEFLSLTAGKIARLICSGDTLEAHRAEALLKRIAVQAMSTQVGRLSSRQEVEERLHAELGRAALELLGEEERKQLFRAVYPVVAGDNHAHKLLSHMCSKQME